MQRLWEMQPGVSDGSGSHKNASVSRVHPVRRLRGCLPAGGGETRFLQQERITGI